MNFFNHEPLAGHPRLAAEAASFHRLPRNGHKDPFDRMIAWQAIVRDWSLASKDPKLEAYRGHGLKLLWGESSPTDPPRV